MSILAIVLLILIGFLLLFIEFLIIPGITIAGIGALILIGGGIFCGYFFHGITAGNYIMLSTGCGLIIFFVFALKLKTWKRFGLKSEIGGRVGTLDDSALLVGDSGVTVSRLAPIGKAMFNDIQYEVRSEGAYIDAHKEVTIINIEGNKIFVELK